MRGYGGDYGRGRARRFWTQAERMEGGYGREYGYSFRRGYDLQGGFGPSGERARSGPPRGNGYGVSRWRGDWGAGPRYDRMYRRELPAWSGPLRVGRRYGHGYGRG